MKRVVKVVLKENLWDNIIIPGRTHHNFASMSSDPLKALNLEKIKSWINDKMKDTIKYRRLQEGDVSNSDASDYLL